MSGTLTDPFMRSRERRRKFAEQLMAQGASTAPVHSPLEGLARALTAGVGGYFAGKADREIEGRDREQSEAVARILGGGAAEAAQPSATPQPVQAEPLAAPAATGAPPAAPQTNVLPQAALAMPDPWAGVPAEWRGAVEGASERTGIPAPMLLAVLRQESGLNPNAVGDGGRSVGLGQIQEATARDPGFGVAPMDPAQRTNPIANINFAADYLAGRGRHAGVTDWGNPAQQDIALRNYNGGGDPNYVQNVRRHLPGAPPAPNPAVTQAATGTPPATTGGAAPGIPTMEQFAQIARLAAQGNPHAQRMVQAFGPLVRQENRAPGELEQLFLAAGLQPGDPRRQQFAEQILARRGQGQQINIQNMGSIPPGYQVERDAQGNPIRMVPIPGSPAAREAEQGDRQRQADTTGRQQQAGIVVQDIDRALRLVDQSTLPTTGLVGGFLSGLPGTNAHDVSRLLDSIEAETAFGRLQRMRDASPTGGALGQVTERELDLLKATMGSLRQSQSQTQFVRNMRRLRNIYLDIIHGPGQGGERLDIEGGQAPAEASPQDGQPVRVQTPDEARRLPSGTRILLPDGSEGVVP